jgi:hypothetical protein
MNTNKHEWFCEPDYAMGSLNRENSSDSGSVIMAYSGGFLLALHLYPEKVKGAGPATFPEKILSHQLPNRRMMCTDRRSPSFINPFVFIRVL